MAVPPKFEVSDFFSPPNRRPSLRPWRRRFDTKLRSKSEYTCTQYLSTVVQLNVWLHCLKLFSLCRPIQKPGQRGICKRCLRLVVHMPWDHFTCERWCNSSPFLWFHVSIGSVSYVFVMKSLCKISCWRVYIWSFERNDYCILCTIVWNCYYSTESQEQFIQDLQATIEELQEQINFLATERDSFKVWMVFSIIVTRVRRQIK